MNVLGNGTAVWFLMRGSVAWRILMSSDGAAPAGAR